MVKRVVDIVCSIAGLAVLLLPMVGIALLVSWTSPGGALYWSQRVGRHGELFWMPKFRTMRVGTPQLSTDLLGDAAQHLTPIGVFLRRLSLDELPQLWSVLIGNMSIVGPRPALFNQSELIAAREERGIHSIRPGLTGWAQVNGRDDISDARKVEFDHEYLVKKSIRMDARIVWMTFVSVMRREGIRH
jgi:O-antigen biosynthesis protein WbqP